MERSVLIINEVIWHTSQSGNSGAITVGGVGDGGGDDIDGDGVGDGGGVGGDGGDASDGVDDDGDDGTYEDVR